MDEAARILVIDDDESVRLTIKGMLESCGHMVALARDGEDGIRQFQQQPYHLVLCDLFMPNKEGLETIKEIHQLSPVTPIISMTGDRAPVQDVLATADPDFLKMSTAFGATEAIAKPFGVRELQALVNRCLGAPA